MISHRSPISGVDAYRDRLVATAGYDGQLILWDPAARRAVARGHHDHLANQCRFSPCGRRLVSASSDYTARIWSVPDMRLRSVLDTHDDDVEMAAFDASGARVATASRDGSVRVFDAGGRELRRLRGHEADVLSVEWTGPSALVSTSDDGTVRRWDAERGEPVETIDFGAVETDTLTVVRGTGELCVGNDRGEVIVISGRECRTVAAHDAGIKRVTAGPGGLLLTTSYDRTAKLWRVRPGGRLEPLGVIDLPPVVWPRSAAFAGPDRVLFGTFGTTYAAYDFSSGTWDLRGFAPTGGINALWVGDGIYTVGDAGVVRRGTDELGRVPSLCNFVIGAAGRIVTGGQTGQLFDAASGEVLHQHRSPLNCADLFDDGGSARLVVGTYTGEALVFDASEGGLRHLDTVRLHDNAVKGLATGAGLLFSVCATGAAAFHSLPGLRPIVEVARAHTRIANGATHLRDGRFASVGRDLRLRIWTPQAGVAIRTPHRHSVKCVAAGPGSDLVATGAYDGTVAVYDPVAGRWPHVERPTTSGISCLAPGSRPGTFLAGSFDGLVYQVAVP